MTRLNRNEEITCENCRAQITKRNIVRHRTSGQVGTRCCTQCLNLSNTSQETINRYIAKKHRVPKPDVIIKCKLCYQEFPGFYALRQHKKTQMAFL